MDDQEICFGLYCIADSLDFLHSRVCSSAVASHSQCKLNHGSLTLRAIFTSDDDCAWKLCCFEHAEDMTSKGATSGKDVIAFVNMVEEIAKLLPTLAQGFLCAT
jgi:hypothetical protein